MAGRRIDIEWTGYYDFTPDEVSALAPVTPGVYKLAWKDEGEKVHIFYVGQTTNLDASLRSHLDGSEPNACVRQHVAERPCVFTLAKVPSAMDRDAVVRALRVSYVPRCNDPADLPFAPDVEMDMN